MKNSCKFNRKIFPTSRVSNEYALQPTFLFFCSIGRMRVFLRVVTNPIWLGVTATTVTENTIVSAYLTYAAKYLQAQFRVPAHLASIHTGRWNS